MPESEESSRKHILEVVHDRQFWNYFEEMILTGGKGPSHLSKEAIARLHAAGIMRPDETLEELETRLERELTESAVTAFKADGILGPNEGAKELEERFNRIVAKYRERSRTSREDPSSAHE